MTSLDVSQPQDYNSRTPIILNRVSTSKQREGLPTQQRFMKAQVKMLGFKKAPIEIVVQQTGAAGDLKTLAEMRKVIEDNPKKQFVVFVRDIPRFARNINQAVSALAFLTERGIPLIPLDMRLPVFNQGSPLRKMTFGILSSVAEGAKAPESDARSTAEKEAAKKGLVKGVPKDSYIEKTKGKQQMRRLVNALRPAVASKALAGNKAAESLGLYPAKFREIVKELEGREAAGKLEEWLEVWDAIVEAENRRGVGSRKKYNKNRSRVKAIHRVTVGYLQFPDTFGRPDTVGNPEVATFPPKNGSASGTIQDALDNPDFYQPTR